MHRCAHRLCLFTLTAVITAGCGVDPDASPTAISLPFSALVNGAPFSCSETYEGIGTTESSVRPVDLRFYVSDVAVLSGGEKVPVTLTDGAFQGQGIALLDFEDDTGSCETGSPEVHTAIEGTVPAGTTVEGVSFVLGVPEELNHLDGATSPAPLNVPGLWWSWSGGYKFMKIDVKNAADGDFFFHHGATDCGGDPTSGFSCAFGNRATVELPLAEDGSVAIDTGRLYAGVDVEAPLAEGDSVPGCMAFPGDPECPAMFAPLGLDFESDAASGEAQTLFSAVTP